MDKCVYLEEVHKGLGLGNAARAVGVVITVGDDYGMIANDRPLPRTFKSLWPTDEVCLDVFGLLEQQPEHPAKYRVYFG